MEPLPPAVEPVIYCYFLLVAAVGCYLHARLWIGARGPGGGDGASNPNSPDPET
ncbi:hypothetical protein [Halopiger djelfimassiliensis]|uniref:hypothetical protein n=1 Tax=Halopiger djelfimassiliensis TaxID=1293047 RepID=UPI000B022C20|nr:hypothetical protein [Halopiger djelfimassiliensis]